MQRKYEKESRQRSFMPNWEKEFTWLKNTNGGMICVICKEYDALGTFHSGFTNFKKYTILKHENSGSHKTNVLRRKAMDDPGYTPAATALRNLNLHPHRITAFYCKLTNKS